VQTVSCGLLFDFCPLAFHVSSSLDLVLRLPGEDLLAEAVAVEASLPTLALSAKDEKEKKKLMEEGFGDWTRKDYRAFTAALEQFGRKDREAVFRQVGAWERDKNGLICGSHILGELRMGT